MDMVDQALIRSKDVIDDQMENGYESTTKEIMEPFRTREGTIIVDEAFASTIITARTAENFTKRILKQQADLYKNNARISKEVQTAYAACIEQQREALQAMLKGFEERATEREGKLKNLVEADKLPANQNLHTLKLAYSRDAQLQKEQQLNEDKLALKARVQELDERVNLLQKELAAANAEKRGLGRTIDSDSKRAKYTKSVQSPVYLTPSPQLDDTTMGKLESSSHPIQKRETTPYTKSLRDSQKIRILNTWKDQLQRANKYSQDWTLYRDPEATQRKFINVLIGARSKLFDATRNMSTERFLEYDHPDYSKLQRLHRIPQKITNPETLQKNPEMHLTHRCLPLKDFYNFLIHDNPGYDQQARSTKYGYNKGLEQSRNLQTSSSAKTSTEPSYSSWGTIKTKAEPSYSSWGTVKQHPLKNPTSGSYRNHDGPKHEYDARLQDLAIDIHRQNEIAKNNAVTVATSDIDDLSDSYVSFSSHLSTDDANRIKHLRGIIRRIKSRDYTKSYLETRDKAIREAEEERVRTGNFPDYLFGVKFPFEPRTGLAHVKYDENQEYILKEQIQDIHRRNAKKHSSNIMQQLKNNRNGSREQVRR